MYNTYRIKNKHKRNHYTCIIHMGLNKHKRKEAV